MRSFARRLCIASLCVSALGFAPRARAEPTGHPQVALEVDPCVAVAVAEVRAIVGVELGALLVDEGVAPTADVTVVRVGCGPATELRVDDPITGKSLGRSVDLSAAAAKARPRLLALAIVELVSASWTELEANPTPAVPAVGAVASPAAREQARDIVRARTPALAPPAGARLRIEALAVRRWFFPTAGGASNGLGVRLGDDRLAGLRALGWSADMLAEHAGSRVALGAVHVDLVSASAVLLAHHELSSIALRAGVGLRVGSARVSGNPADSSRVDASSVAGAWGGPLVSAAVGVAALRPVVLELAAEGGWCVVPVRGHVGEARDVGAIGPWVGVTLGVGVQPL